MYEEVIKWVVSFLCGGAVSAVGMVLTHIKSQKKSQSKNCPVYMLTQPLPESVRKMQMTLEFCHYYFLTVARGGENTSIPPTTPPPIQCLHRSP